MESRLPLESMDIRCNCWMPSGGPGAVGALIVNVRAFEVAADPTPAVTWAVPALAIRAEDTSATASVSLMANEDKGMPFQKMVELRRFAPVIRRTKLNAPAVAELGEREVREGLPPIAPIPSVSPDEVPPPGLGLKL